MVLSDNERPLDLYSPRNVEATSLFLDLCLSQVVWSVFLLPVFLFIEVWLMINMWFSGVW